MEFVPWLNVVTYSMVDLSAQFSSTIMFVLISMLPPAFSKREDQYCLTFC